MASSHNVRPHFRRWWQHCVARLCTNDTTVGYSVSSLCCLSKIERNFLCAALLQSRSSLPGASRCSWTAGSRNRRVCMHARSCKSRRVVRLRAERGRRRGQSILCLASINVLFRGTSSFPKHLLYTQTRAQYPSGGES